MTWYRWEVCPRCGKPNRWGAGMCKCPQDGIDKALAVAGNLDWISSCAAITGVPFGCLFVVCMLLLVVIIVYL